MIPTSASRAARRWLSDRDARSLNFLEIDDRHLTGVRSVEQVAHYYVNDRPRWEYELHVHLFELTYRTWRRSWTTDVWMVDHTANVWPAPDADNPATATPLVLFSTEEVFTSGRLAMDRYAERRHVMHALFTFGTSYLTERPTP